MVTGLPDAALEDDDDEELQAAAVRASTTAPATATGRRGTNLWKRTVTSASVLCMYTDRRRKLSHW